MKNFFFVLLVFGFSYNISAQKRISKKEKVEVYKKIKDSIWKDYLKEVEIEIENKANRRAYKDSISELKKANSIAENKVDTLCPNFVRPYYKSKNSLGIEKEVNLIELCNSHIRKNFNYPEFALEYDIEGRVDVNFIIDKTGLIKEIYAFGPHNGLVLEKEAIRIMQKLPKLQPGLCNGKETNVKFMIPIIFIGISV